VSIRAEVAKGLTDVAYMVQDVPYLASIVQVVQTEREAMLTVGKLQLDVLRLAMRNVPELANIVALAERVFGEEV
jgi:division protein CdvB (Snf7/Vps24/ESCRT-III family)